MRILAIDEASSLGSSIVNIQQLMWPVMYSNSIIVNGLTLSENYRAWPWLGRSSANLCDWLKRPLIIINGLDSPLFKFYSGVNFVFFLTFYFFPRIFGNFHEFSWIFMNFRKFSRIFMNFRKFSWIFGNLKRVIRSSFGKKLRCLDLPFMIFVYDYDLSLFCDVWDIILPNGSVYQVYPRHRRSW